MSEREKVPDQPSAAPLAPARPRPAWEADFPVERLEAQHVSRREFAKFLVLASGSLAVGNAWVAAKDRLLPARRVEREHRLCAVGDLAVGGMLAFTVPETGQPAILIHLDDDQWRAYEQKCTHLSCAVYYSALSGKIECPCHQGFFDGRTGLVLQGPPSRPLPRLTIALRDGEVLLTPPGGER
jgi:cytochrome b6-f complex iron-sulfur subunit